MSVLDEGREVVAGVIDGRGGKVAVERDGDVFVAADAVLDGFGNSGRSTHFVAKGEHGKGQCHHKRHGKDYHVHIAIITHIGHLQHFCYVYVTLLWPILN